MIDNQKYVILSLELHLFFSRIMKEHALFLEAGFTNKNYNLAMEADHYKKQFEDLLSYTVSASNGIIRPDILYSEELVTTLTSVAEQKTEEFTGIEINKNITTRELNLQSGEVGRYRLVHITVTGLHHPLREPYVPLSEYTALLLFVRKNSLSTFTCVYESRDDDNESIQQEFYVVSLSLPFPNA